MLNLNHVSVSYGKENRVKVLDGVSFSVEEGEIVALMGKSGAGKTTLLKTLAGLLPMDDGTIELHGLRIDRIPMNERRVMCAKKIGFVWQDFQLVREYDLEQNILLPSVIQKKPYDTHYFQELVEWLGIGDKLRQYPDQLSGGEQQRGCIARAMLLKPEIILADEPTGSLDSENSQNIMRLIRDGNKRFTQTMLLSTHDRDMGKFAGRIITLHDGRVINAK